MWLSKVIQAQTCHVKQSSPLLEPLQMSLVILVQRGKSLIKSIQNSGKLVRDCDHLIMQGGVD